MPGLSDLNNNGPGMVRSVTAAYTASKTDSYVFAVGTFTVTLPAAAQVPGQLYTVVQTGAGAVTVATVSGNISGGSTFALDAANDGVTVVSDGTNYWIVSATIDVAGS